jgi:hypothetical protein
MSWLPGPTWAGPAIVPAMVSHPVPVIRWSTSDPDALAGRLRDAGLAFGADGVLGLPSATIRIEMGAGVEDRLVVEDGDEAAAPSDPPSSGAIGDVVAIGWATVDRERFLADATAGANVDLPRDPHLGAFAVRHGAAESWPQILVLEPDTEGRLVGSLVRFAEGPAAVYVVAHDGLEAFVAAARRRGTPISGVRPGPLGPSAILLGGPTWGPHLLVVDRPSGGTIAT